MEPARAPRPRRVTLRELIRTNPEARARIGRAYSELLMAVLASIAALGALLVWIIVRRSRRVRDQLSPPQRVRWPRLWFEESSREKNHSGD